jgi:glycosyltransferase involved in cell wall biosynthesis
MKSSKKINILILLWHSQDAIAGGFVRVKELVSNFRNINIKIIDNSPSLIPHGKYPYVSTTEYGLPSFIKNIYKYNYLLGRALEWMHACYSLVSLGRSELKKENIDIIYGPTGDNLHIFIAGIILKWMFPSKKLLLDILNLEMPEGSAGNYFRNFRKSNVNILGAALRTYSLAVLLFIEKILIKNCDFVVTVSPYMRRVIAKHYPIEKIDFTPSGVSIPEDLNLNSNKKYDGLYVGRHTKDKGIFDIIKVWDKVYKKTPDKKMVTAGSYQKEIGLLLDKEIKEKKLDDNMRRLGMISEERKWKLFSESKFFLHLAYSEPLVPVISILEALAAGLPVIMYDQSSLEVNSSLRHHPAMFIIGNGNIEGVVETVLYLGSLPKERFNVISKEARKLAQRFSWDIIANKEQKIIEKI